MQHKCIQLIFVLAFAGQTVLAQQGNVSGSQPIDRLAADLAKVNVPADPNDQSGIKAAEDNITRILGNVLTTVLLVEPAAKKEARWLDEMARVDKQMGGSSGASGSTSLVSSGSVPFLLGFAVENGALTREESGTSVTFRANPANIARALRSGDKTRTMKGLNVDDFTFAFTFDTSRGEKAGTLTGSGEEFSQFFLRVNLINNRDPRSTKWDAKWEEFAQSVRFSHASGDFPDAYSEMADELDADVAYRACKIELVEEVLAKPADPTKAQEKVRAALDRFIGCAQPSLRGERSRKLLQAWRSYLEKKHAMTDSIRRSWTLAFEYTLDRAAKKEAMDVMSQEMDDGAAPGAEPPDLSTFRLILSKGFAWQDSELTLNGSLSIFNDTIEGRGRMRDYQFGAMFDIPLPEIPQIGKSTFTLSGLFVSLKEMPFGVPLTINGKQVGLAGDMGLFQAKWSLPMGDSGVRVPFSLTWSNRTELIDEDEVRAGIGITFDLDKLFNKQ